MPKAKRKGKYRGKRNEAGFTPQELRFIHNFQGDQQEAARLAGYQYPKQEGYRLMQKPHIKAAIEKKLAKTLEQNAKDFAHKVTVSRNDIINGLHQEALKAESDSARVSAWGHLADIFKLKEKSKSELDIFAGWTDEELDFYRRTGEIPASRFGLSAESTDEHSRETGLSASGLPANHGPALGTGSGNRSAAPPSPPAGK